MKVGGRLFANFRELAPHAIQQSTFEMDLSDDACRKNLLAVFHLPDHLPKIVLVDGKFIPEEARLSQGDEVSICPPLIAGGW